MLSSIHKEVTDTKLYDLIMTRLLCVSLNTQNVTTRVTNLSLIPILSTSLMQELTSIFILSSLLLVNSRTLCLILYFLLPMTCTLLKEEYQDTCLTKLILVLILSSLLKRGKASGLFFLYLCYPWPRF